MAAHLSCSTKTQEHKIKEHQVAIQAAFRRYDTGRTSRQVFEKQLTDMGLELTEAYHHEMRDARGDITLKKFLRALGTADAQRWSPYDNISTVREPLSARNMNSTIYSPKNPRYPVPHKTTLKDLLYKFTNGHLTPAELRLGIYDHGITPTERQEKILSRCEHDANVTVQELLMAFSGPPQQTRWGNFNRAEARCAKPDTLEAPKSQYHIFHKYDDDNENRPHTRTHSDRKYKEHVKGKGNFFTWNDVDQRESKETHYRPMSRQTQNDRKATRSSLALQGPICARDPQNEWDINKYCSKGRGVEAHRDRDYLTERDMLHWDGQIVDTRRPRPVLPPSPKPIPQSAPPPGPPMSNISAPFGNEDNWTVEMSVQRQQLSRRWCKKDLNTRTNRFRILANQDLQLTKP